MVRGYADRFLLLGRPSHVHLRPSPDGKLKSALLVRHRVHYSWPENPRAGPSVIQKRRPGPILPVPPMDVLRPVLAGVVFLRSRVLVEALGERPHVQAHCRIGNRRRCHIQATGGQLVISEILHTEPLCVPFFFLRVPQPGQHHWPDILFGLLLGGRLQKVRGETTVDYL